jgi:hypothetical protein
MQPQQTQRLIQLIVTCLLVGMLLIFIGGVSRWLLFILVAVCGLSAATVWMLRYHRATLARAYPNPAVKWFVDLICRWAKEQPPVDACETASAPPPARPPAPPAPPPPPTTTAAAGTGAGSGGGGGVGPSASGGYASASVAGGPATATGGAKAKSSDGNPLLAWDRADFAVLRENLKSVVFGHDTLLDEVTAHIEDQMEIRRGPSRGGSPPLGVFLLVGPDGVGKRHLAEELSKRVYEKSPAVRYDMNDYADAGGAGLARLFGTVETAGGLLIGAVRAKPFRIVILENIESAPEKLRDKLRQVFTDGTIVEEATGSRVSFQHVVFFLTTRSCVAALRRCAGLPRGEFLREARDALSVESALDMPFLSTVQAVLLCASLSPQDKAKVIGLLFVEECERYNLVLEYVNPGILMEEAEAITDSHGFGTARARVRERLRDPLVEARRNGHTHIRLP